MEDGIDPCHLDNADSALIMMQCSWMTTQNSSRFDSKKDPFTAVSRGVAEG